MGEYRDTSAGISLRDAQDALRAVQSEHCCDIKVELSMPVASGTAVLFWVTAVATPRIVGRKTIRGPSAVGRRWPHVDHKTLAGLIFWLAHELDRKLAEQGHVPAEQAAFDFGS